MNDRPRPLLSVVSTLYRSAASLRDFHRLVTEQAARFSPDYEIVLVNDGSPDESLAIAVELGAADPHVRVIDLSRNFGHHKALMTGISKARGEYVFLIDSDLEEDPAWLHAFHETMTASGADVVYGVQASRKGSWFERWTGRLFFRGFNLMLTHPIPENVITARLMTRRYARALVQHRDREVCLAGLWVITGFDQRAMPVQKKSRPASTYSLRRRVSVFVNAITSFSNRPLVYIFQIGIAVMALSIAAGLTLLYATLRGHVGVPGWASLMVSIWFLGGLTIFCVGVIGVYISKVFIETKRRPYTVIRREYGGGRVTR